jgi:hypothetical protein
LVEKHRDELIAIQVEETTSTHSMSGKFISFRSLNLLVFTCSSDFGIKLTLECLNEIAAACTMLRGEVACAEPSERAYIEYCPYGIVYSSSPWNAPYVSLSKSEQFANAHDY